MNGTWQRHPLLAIAVLLLAGCGGGQVAAPINSYSVSSKQITPISGPDRRALVHIIRRGETLYSIAWQYGKNVRDLARWNAIVPPHTILPGQKLRLTAPPQAAPGTARAAPPPSKPQVTPKPPKPAQPPTRTTKPNPKPVVAASAHGLVRWQWPVKGRLLRTFSATDSTRNGIDISGTFGQPVIAASAGRVVYSGNGLVGYGNLIIINHGGDYLSAYGHNRELLVHEGDTVKNGQLIARMGKADNGQPYLHFEIRRHGRPVDPMPLLPKG